jgi:hypothetical protein
MSLKSAPVRPPLLQMLGGVQVFICIALGALSLFFIGPEIKRADASASIYQQAGGTAIVAGIYIANGLIALWDIRASSLLAVCLSLLSTPLFAFLLLMSQWSTQSAQAARPLLFFIIGNVVLFSLSLWAIVNIALSREWSRTR